MHGKDAAGSPYCKKARVDFFVSHRKLRVVESNRIEMRRIFKERDPSFSHILRSVAKWEIKGGYVEEMHIDPEMGTRVLLVLPADKRGEERLELSERLLDIPPPPLYSIRPLTTNLLRFRECHAQKGEEGKIGN